MPERNRVRGGQPQGLEFAVPSRVILPRRHAEPDRMPRRHLPLQHERLMARQIHLRLHTLRPGRNVQSWKPRARAVPTRILLPRDLCFLVGPFGRLRFQYVMRSLLASDSLPGRDVQSTHEPDYLAIVLAVRCGSVYRSCGVSGVLLSWPQQQPAGNLPPWSLLLTQGPNRTPLSWRLVPCDPWRMGHLNLQHLPRRNILPERHGGSDWVPSRQVL
mmetsp:Transcript_15245/g.35942  ORF Transcript_15245/g.35942 Transcript_15245/m.35942 type:complete len:216 (-) Transcript_15245:413-1060(-)